MPEPDVPGVERVEGDTEPGCVLGVPRPEPLGVVVPLVEFTPDAPVPAPVSVALFALPGVAVVSPRPAPELPGVAVVEPEPGAPRLFDVPRPLLPDPVPLIPDPLVPVPAPA